LWWETAGVEWFITATAGASRGMGSTDGGVIDGL
jgi:hypothetical protein